ncbi:MAG: ABC transporter permease, partial [Mycobacteriaceae bacterium]
MAVPGLIDTPLRALGQFFAMTLDVLRYSVRRPFQWGEFIDQCWFIARVSMVPTVLVALPFTVLVSFTLNILLKEIGAAD